MVSMFDISYMNITFFLKNAKITENINDKMFEKKNKYLNLKKINI